MNDITLKMAQKGNKDALSEITQKNAPLVWSIVKRFSGRGTDDEDLFQIGNIGLIKAVYRFSPDFGTQFSTYAVPLIMGEIRRFLRDDGAVKVSRSIKETAQKASALIEEVRKKNGIDLKITEVACMLGKSPEEISMALSAAGGTESLYKEEGDAILMDFLYSEESPEQKCENKILAQEILKSAEPLERKVIYMRYFQEKTQNEIAQILGITQVKVSRTEKKFILRMREKYS